MRKTKITEDQRSFKWDVWTNLIIQTSLVLITVCTFFVSQKSTKIAQDALALQRTQLVESHKQDSIKSIQDSTKNERFIQLAEQQILALKNQAKATEKGVRNNIVSQSPYLDITMLGYHFVDEDKTNVMPRYLVVNNGVRPAILKKVTEYLLNEKFKILERPIVERLNYRLTQDKPFLKSQPIFLDDQQYFTFDVNKIARLPNVFRCILLEYTDPFLSKNILIKDKPVFYKWVRMDPKDYIIHEKYIPLVNCSDEEESAIMKSINEYKKKNHLK